MRRPSLDTLQFILGISIGCLMKTAMDQSWTAGERVAVWLLLLTWGCIVSSILKRS